MIAFTHKLSGALVDSTTIVWNRHLPEGDADEMMRALDDGLADDGKVCTHGEDHMDVAEHERELSEIDLNEDRWRRRVSRTVEIARKMLAKAEARIRGFDAVDRERAQLMEDCRRLQGEVESLKRDLRAAQVAALSPPEKGAVKYPCAGCGTVQLVDGTEVTVTCPKCGAVGRGPGAFARRKV